MTSIQPTRPNNGILRYVEEGEVIEIRFVPTQQAIRLARRGAMEPVRIATADLKNNRMQIYPIRTIPREKDFLHPKFTQIRCIDVPYRFWRGVEPEFDDFLPGLPRGLTKDYQYGLGLPREYFPVVEMVEKCSDSTTLILQRGGAVEYQGPGFVLPLEDFEAIRAELDRITGRGQAAALRVKQAHVRNYIAPSLNMEQSDYRRGSHPVTQYISDEAAGRSKLTRVEQEQLVGHVVAQSRTLARDRPALIEEVRKSVELAQLDATINGFVELNSSTHRKIESHWQGFFRDNPAALHLAFGHPINIVAEQATVGGLQVSGKGEKVTDFLLKNAMTNNVAVFEIKTPNAPLLQRTEHRRGVFAPSKELGEGVSQVLDQRYQLEKHLVGLKEASKDRELEQYSVRACLVIGEMPTADDQVKSFELFRASVSNIQIITYDELVLKLRSLRRVLDFAREASA